QGFDLRSSLNLSAWACIFESKWGESMRPILAVLCLLLVVSAGFAQSDRGTVTGAIADQTSAVIPGASIVATNTETGARYETISTETGNYTLAQLPAGVYQLS